MSLIFLSHSSQDNEHAEKLATWLREKQQRSIFLDFDPAAGIPAGHDWEKELYSQLRQCQAVIVLCSKHSMDSEWCFAEVMFSKALGKHIFPVRLDQSTIWPILSSLQITDFTANIEEGLERLWRAMMLKGLDPKSIFDWDGSRPPYPGLPAFEEGDAAIFFGREEEIHEVIAELNLSRQLGDARMMILEGVSGSGKSSLLRAGVIPRLKNDRNNWIVVEPFRPLSNPLHELTVALKKTLSRYQTSDELMTDIGEIITAFEARNPSTDLLNRAAQILQSADADHQSTVVLIIDQFEEILVPEQNDEIAYFTQLLSSSLSAVDCEFLLIATMRADFRGQFEVHPELGRLPFKTYPVIPLKIDAFEKIITGPAELAGLELESGLVSAMIQDIETRNSLPLLAFTLRELWNRYGSDKIFTISEYREKLGGINNAVAKVAELVLRANAPSGKQLEEVRAAFVSLARINEEGQYVRQPQLWDDLPKGSHRVMEDFVDKRLLVSRIDENNSQRLTEVAHEALFQTWTRLKQWLDAERGFLEWRHRLQTEIADWEHVNQDKGALLRGATLNEALTWLEKKSSQLREKEQIFIQKSRHRRTRLRTLVTSTGIISILAISASAVIAFVQRNEAITQLANNYWFSGVDERDDKKNTLKASHYFMHSASVSRKHNKQDADGTFLAGHFLNGELKLVTIIEDPSNKPDWFELTGSCPDNGNKLKTVYKEGRIYLPGNTDTSEHKFVRCAVYGPDRKKILSWGDDHFLRVWTDTGEKLLDIKHNNVHGAIFNPDQSRILSWSQDNTAMLWDAHNGQRLSPEMLHENPIKVAAFSPDEAFIATSDDKKNIRKWKIQGARPLTLLPGNKETSELLENAAWNASCQDKEGKAIYSGPHDWKNPRLFEPEEYIFGCDFHPVTKKLLVWTPAFDLRLWNADTKEILFEKQVDDHLSGAAISFSGDKILAWFNAGESTGNMLRIYEIPNTQPEKEWHQPNPVVGATTNRAQDKVLVWDESGGLMLRDLYSGGDIFPSLKHDGVEQAIFSPDEKYILSWDNYVLRVWDAENGRALTPKLKHKKGSIEDVALDMNKRQILVRLDLGKPEERGMRIWNFPGSPVQNHKNPILHQEIITGTRLDLETSELYPLNNEEWVLMKQRLDSTDN